MVRTQCVSVWALVAASWIAGCSQGNGETATAVTSSFSPSMAKAAKKEPITLRGISFDQGDVRQAIADLCLSDATRRGRKEQDVKKDGFWCTVDKENRMRLPDFQFGNLSGFLGSTVLLDENGILLRFEASASKGEILELVAPLEDKYGKPTMTQSEVRNGFGTKFDKRTYVWTDERGTMIRAESMYDRVDDGRVVIESRSYQTAREMREKVMREINKAKL